MKFCYRKMTTLVSPTQWRSQGVWGTPFAKIKRNKREKEDKKMKQNEKKESIDFYAADAM